MSTRNLLVLIVVLAAIAVVLILAGGRIGSGALLSPEGVVEDFYRTWIGYEGNPLEEKIYRSSESVSPDLSARIDTILESSTAGGFDPVLCAQDKPADFQVGRAVVDGGLARVPVLLDFYGMSKAIEVELAKNGDQWQLAHISCTAPGNLNTVKLFYYNPAQDKDAAGNLKCSRDGLIAVERKIADSDNLIADALQLLMEGDLKLEEKMGGITTEFPLTGLRLATSTLQGGELTLVFDDPEGRTSGGACRSSLLRFEIEATAKQFSGVEEVRFEPETLFQP